jgi:hypothetical protein
MTGPRPILDAQGNFVGGYDYERNLGIDSPVFKHEWDDFLLRRKMLMEMILGSASSITPQGQPGQVRPSTSYDPMASVMQQAGHPVGRPAAVEELIAQAHAWDIPDPERMTPQDLYAMIQQKRAEIPEEEIIPGMALKAGVVGMATEAAGATARVIGNLFGGVEELPFAGHVLASIMGTEKAKRWMYDFSMRAAEVTEMAKMAAPRGNIPFEIMAATGKVAGYALPAMATWNALGALGAYVPPSWGAAVVNPIARAAIHGGLTSLALEYGSDEANQTKAFSIGMGAVFGAATQLGRAAMPAIGGLTGAAIGGQVGDTPEERGRHAIEGTIAGVLAGLAPQIRIATAKVRGDIPGPFDTMVDEAINADPIRALQQGQPAKQGTARIADPAQLQSGPDFEIADRPQPQQPQLLVRAEPVADQPQPVEGMTQQPPDAQQSQFLDEVKRATKEGWQQGWKAEAETPVNQIEVKPLNLPDAAASADAMTKQAMILESSTLPDAMSKVKIGDVDVIRAALSSNPGGKTIIRGITNGSQLMRDIEPDWPVRFVQQGDKFDVLVGVGDHEVAQYKKFGVFDGLKVTTASGLTGTVWPQESSTIFPGMRDMLMIQLPRPGNVRVYVRPEEIVPTNSADPAPPTLDLWNSFKLDFFNHLNQDLRKAGMHPLYFHGSPAAEIVGEFNEPAFFTPELSAANFYRTERSTYPEEQGSLTAVSITPKNPLFIGDKAGVQRLSEIARSAGAEVKMEDLPMFSPETYSFESSTLDTMGRIGDNPFDLLYIPEVRDAVRAAGYDAVVGFDAFMNYDIPATVPLDPALIQRMGAPLPIDDPRVMSLMQQHMSDYFDRLGVTDPAKRQALELDFNQRWMTDVTQTEHDPMMGDLGMLQRELVSNALLAHSESSASDSHNIPVSIEELAEKRGFIWIAQPGEGGAFKDTINPGIPDIPVATDEAAKEFLARIDRTLPDLNPVSDIPLEVAEMLPTDMGQDPRMPVEHFADSLSDTVDGLQLEESDREGAITQWASESLARSGGGGGGYIPPSPPTGGAGAGGFGLGPGERQTLGGQFAAMRRASPEKLTQLVYDFKGLMSSKFRYTRYATLKLEELLSRAGIDLGKAWQHYEELDTARARAFNASYPWLQEWGDIMRQFPTALGQPSAMRDGSITRIHEIEDTNARMAAFWRLQQSHGLSEAHVNKYIAADARITDFMQRFFQFLTGDPAFSLTADREIFRYMPRVRARQAQGLKDPYDTGSLSPEVQFFGEFARDGNLQFRIMDARELGTHMVRAAMFKKYEAEPWENLVNAWQDERVPESIQKYMMDFARLSRYGYDPSGELAVRGIQSVMKRVFRTPVSAHEAQHLLNMPTGLMYLNMLAGHANIFFRDATQPFMSLAKVQLPYMIGVYKDILLGARKSITAPEISRLREMYLRHLDIGTVERENPNLEAAGIFEEPIQQIEGQLSVTPEEAHRREILARVVDVAYGLPAWLVRPAQSSLNSLKWYGRQGQLHRLIVGEAAYRQAEDKLNGYRLAELSAILNRDPTLAMPYEKLAEDAFFSSFEKPIQRKLQALVEQGDDEGAKQLFAREVANWSQFRYGRRENPEALRGNIGRAGSVLGSFTGQFLEATNSGMSNGTPRHRIRYGMVVGAFSALMYELWHQTGWSFHRWAWVPNAFQYVGGPLLEKAATGVEAAFGANQLAQGYKPNEIQGAALREVTGPGSIFGSFIPYSGYVKSLAEYSAAAQGVNPFEQAMRYTVTGDRGSRIDMERTLEEHARQQETPVPEGVQSPNGGLMPGHGGQDPRAPYRMPTDQGYGFPGQQPPIPKDSGPGSGWQQ